MLLMLWISLFLTRINSHNYYVNAF